LEALELLAGRNHNASIGKQHKYTDAKRAGQPMAEMKNDFHHRVLQREVRRAAGKRIKVRDRKPFCFSLVRLNQFAFG
jgi:hypothetical protein